MTLEPTTTATSSQDTDILEFLASMEREVMYMTGTLDWRSGLGSRPYKTWRPIRGTPNLKVEPGVPGSWVSPAGKRAFPIG